MRPALLNSIAADISEREENVLLTQLAGHLVQLGVEAELRDNCALVLRRPAPNLPVWVFVGYGGRCYAWHQAEHRHPSHDPEGAAKILAEYISQ